MEMKKSERVLEDVASDVQELLALAKDAREKEDAEGDVAEEIRAAAVQLTRTVEEQAADIGNIATRLEDDLKRAAGRVEGMSHGGSRGRPRGLVLMRRR
jgi:methyl-accepting chemotaxis protein